MAPSLGSRFYRAVRLEEVVTNLSLSLDPANRQAHLAITAKPNKTIVTQASTDLLHWINISTDIPPTNYFQVLDTNAPGFNKRFYRAVGQGK